MQSIYCCKSWYDSIINIYLDFVLQDAIEVVIGVDTDQGRYSYIKNGVDGTVLAEARTPGVLMCGQYKELWVSFFRGHIRVGQNNAYTNMFLEYQGSHMGKLINAIRVTSGGDAVWEFYQDQSKHMILQLT